MRQTEVIAFVAAMPGLVVQTMPRARESGPQMISDRAFPLLPGQEPSVAALGHRQLGFHDVPDDLRPPGSR
jgi:hypothetical protein